MKKLLYIVLALCMFMSCARMGSPDGGWYDDDPPKLVSSMPAEFSTNVKNKASRIRIIPYIK